MQEVWKDIGGYEGLYMVSNMGRIKSLMSWNGSRYIHSEKIINGWVQNIKNKNYSRRKVRLVKDGVKREFMVHRLVAEAFIPNPHNYETVNHKDFNPLNNNASNLEWMTLKDNNDYSTNAGRRNRLLKDNMLEICLLYQNGVSGDEIADMFNVSKSTVLSKLRENGIDIKTNSFYRNKYNINREELLQDFKNGMKNKDLVVKYNCSRDIIATYKYKFKQGGLL